MSTRWDSVIFRDNVDSLADLARAAVPAALLCKPKPNVQVHFFVSKGFISAELTAFSRRELELSPDAATLIPAQVVALGGRTSPHVLLAQAISDALRSRCIAIAVSESTNTAQYALFDSGAYVKGKAATFDAAGASPGADQIDGVVAEAMHEIAPELAVTDSDGLFASFYEESSHPRSFLIIERGTVLGEPRALP